MKTLNDLRTNIVPFAVLVLPFIVLALLWPRFPETVAVHWGPDGRPNGWMPKLPGLLIVPVTNIGLWALITMRSKTDPRLRNQEELGRMTEALSAIRLGGTCFMTFAALLIIAAALNLPFDMNRMISTGLLLMFLVMGNFLGNLRPNYFAGIRTPWTLEDPEIWRKTHRLGGRFLFFGCAMLLVADPFLSGLVLIIGTIGLVLVWSVWAMAYSYWLFLTKRRSISNIGP